jgi:hypothetical protein
MPGLDKDGGWAAHVVAVGTDTTQCNFDSYGLHNIIDFPTGASLTSMQFDVKCFGTDGQLRSSAFVLFFGKGTQVGHYASVRTLDESGTAWDFARFNSTGGTNEVRRLSTGNYLVTLPGLTSANAGVHVTARGIRPAWQKPTYCTAGPWSAGSVYVQCFNTDGVRTNSMFDLSYSNRMLVPYRIGGHAWINGSSVPSAYRRVTTALAEFGTVTVSGFGPFRLVSYGGTDAGDDMPYAPLVTAYNGSHFCKLVGSFADGSDHTLMVQCYTPTGTSLAAPQFTSSLVGAYYPAPF